jgi:hypothetical protein
MRSASLLRVPGKFSIAKKKVARAAVPAKPNNVTRDNQTQLDMNNQKMRVKGSQRDPVHNFDTSTSLQLQIMVRLAKCLPNAAAGGTFIATIKGLVEIKSCY